MIQSRVVVHENDSAQPEDSHLIVSVRNITMSSGAELVIGYPGLSNIERTLFVGEAVLFETIDSGILEVRLFRISSIYVELLISQVSPRIGIRGGFIDEDPNNAAFTKVEINRIEESIGKIQKDLSGHVNFTPEQLDLLNRKLDEIKLASNRLGRKDWIMYISGSLTSFAISSALAPEATNDLFKVVSNALKWLFNTALLLL